MDSKVIIGIVVAVVALLALPFLPKLLKGAQKADPAADNAAATQIQNAIQDYKMKKGMPPPSLDALVPEFIATVPKTSTGGPFTYDPGIGQVYSPTVAAAPPPPGDTNRRNGPVTVGGPMGETMTGIGIADELN